MTREPEWSDAERDRMLALAVYEGQICDCGHHASLTDDPENFFTFDERVCPVCRGAARFMRVQQDRDEQAAKGPDGKPRPANTARPSDGRRLHVRQLTETEKQALREGAQRGNTA